MHARAEIVEKVLKKMMAVRYFKRSQELSDVDPEVVRAILREAETTPEEAEEIYAMTALPTVYERFVLPPIQREEAIEGSCSPELCKGECGVGFVRLGRRGA